MRRAAYLYEDLGTEQFEKLVVLICEEIFGAGVTSFSTGPDGGRDARFDGTAQLYPSTSSPWVGKTVIQAKHSIGHDKSCSDPDFYSESRKNSTITDEVEKVVRLIDRGELDNYIIFTNRTLTAGAEERIRTYIAESTGLEKKNAAVIGLENLERYVEKFPDIPDRANLDPVDMPLTLDPRDLSEVIEGLAEALDVSADDAPLKLPVPRTELHEKNRLNNLSNNYSDELKSRYLKDASIVHEHLSDPSNQELQRIYEAAAEDIQFKIIAKREDYPNFDDVLNHVIEMLLLRSSALHRGERKKILRCMVFYMYWFCDVGRNE